MTAHDAAVGAIDVILTPAAKDLGDHFVVRRALPAARRRMVGPFVFLDEMGPAAFGAGTGLDVRPHPHIGLSTVTYLFEGAIRHKDTLGVELDITPGALNLMTAGRGVAHSERTPPDVRAAGGPVWGLQAWLALARAAEACDPAFRHVPAADLPLLEADGVRLRLILGSGFGVTAPVETSLPAFYADVGLDFGARIEVPAFGPERAIYVAAGAVEIDGVRIEAGRLVVLAGSQPVMVQADADARIALLGGESDGPRRLWWNFVSSDAERIEQAKADWAAGRFGLPEGEAEFIPLP
jgi:hypothetical protein